MANKIADDTAAAVLVLLVERLHFATTRRFGRFIY